MAKHARLRVVVLVDEYDKPILDRIEDTEIARQSGLNNLNDITLDGRYGDICGYTDRGGVQQSRQKHCRVRG